MDNQQNIFPNPKRTRHKIISLTKNKGRRFTDGLKYNPPLQIQETKASLIRSKEKTERTEQNCRKLTHIPHPLTGQKPE